MSYTYLFNSRLPYQRMPPSPAPGSMDALLESRSRESVQLLKTQIAINSPHEVTRDCEPLPELDYHMLYVLINVLRPYLSKRDLKRFDYVAQTRKWYFVGLAKFQEAYRELEDANAYAKILDKQFDELAQEYSKTISSSPNESTSPDPDIEQHVITLNRKMATIELARRKNNQDLQRLLSVVDRRTKARDHSTAFFSDLKRKFSQREVPALMEMGKHFYAHQERKKAEQQKRSSGNPSTSPAPQAPQAPQSSQSPPASQAPQATQAPVAVMVPPAKSTTPPNNSEQGYVTKKPVTQKAKIGNRWMVVAVRVPS
ncbi:hypothetical protein ACLMJK_005286 [Lecanora helva]